MSGEYQARFGKHAFKESLNWLVEQDVITDEDRTKIVNLKNYRNELAHEMAEYVAAEKPLRNDYFIAVYEMLKKIDQWWAYNFDIDFDDEEIDQDVKMESIESGSMIMLQLLNHVYTGDNTGLERIYMEFLKRAREMGFTQSRSNHKE